MHVHWLMCSLMFPTPTQYEWPAIIICVMFTMSLLAGVVPEGGEHGMVVGSGGHQSGPSVALWSVGGLVAWENSSSTGTKVLDCFMEGF